MFSTYYPGQDAFIIHTSQGTPFSYLCDLKRIINNSLKRTHLRSRARIQDPLANPVSPGLGIKGYLPAPLIFSFHNIQWRFRQYHLYSSVYVMDACHPMQLTVPPFRFFLPLQSYHIQFVAKKVKKKKMKQRDSTQPPLLLPHHYNYNHRSIHPISTTSRLSYPQPTHQNLPYNPTPH